MHVPLRIGKDIQDKLNEKDRLFCLVWAPDKQHELIICFVHTEKTCSGFWESGDNSKISGGTNSIHNIYSMQSISQQDLICLYSLVSKCITV